MGQVNALEYKTRITGWDKQRLVLSNKTVDRFLAGNSYVTC